MLSLHGLLTNLLVCQWESNLLSLFFYVTGEVDYVHAKCHRCHGGKVYPHCIKWDENNGGAKVKKTRKKSTALSG